MIETLGLLALGSLGTLFALAVWTRLDLLSRIRFDGELRIGPRKINWADAHERAARQALEKIQEHPHQEDFFSMSQRLAKEDGDGKA
jgi:hypothetical protein